MSGSRGSERLLSGSTLCETEHRGSLAKHPSGKHRDQGGDRTTVRWPTQELSFDSFHARRSQPHSTEDALHPKRSAAQSPTASTVTANTSTPKSGLSAPRRNCSAAPTAGNPELHSVCIPAVVRSLDHGDNATALAASVPFAAASVAACSADCNLGCSTGVRHVTIYGIKSFSRHSDQPPHASWRLQPR